MSNLPTPLRAALGLAATALDEARKLPETLPQLPVAAITTAMQASLRVQQHLAALAARGDEVISQLRGSSSEPPEWATFDEPPSAAGDAPTAAFDRVDHDAELEPARFEPAEVGGTEPAGTVDTGPAGTGDTGPAGTGDAEPSAGSAAQPTAKPAKAVKPAKTAVRPNAATVSKPTGPAKRAKPAKSTRPPKTAGPDRSPSPAPSDEPTAPVSEPLRRAASRAKPNDPPNPVTMAAEIVQAAEAEQAGSDATGEAGSGQE